MKPHIRFDKNYSEWVCTLDICGSGSVIGFGNNPRHAFDNLINSVEDLIKNVWYLELPQNFKNVINSFLIKARGSV